MDEPHADASLFRKASFTFWLLGALMLFVVVLVGFSLFGPNPPIIISKATTHITTPLDANGLPDYAAVLLADSRKGVTPENNGAVPFLMAMWPGEKKSDDEYSEGYTPEEAKLLCSELGLPGIPPADLQVTPISNDKNRLAALRLLRERLPKPKNLPPVEAEEILEEADPDGYGMGMGMGGMGGGYGRMGLMTDEEFFTLQESEAIKDGRVSNLIDYCQPVDRPWTTEDLPFLAGWLDENNTAIDLIVKGAERSEWHWPTSGLLRGGSGAVNDSLSLNNVQQIRNAARLLTTRCCFYQGKGEYKKAIRNALAILRLAHHTSKGPFYVDQLVAAAIGGIGLRAVDRIIADQTTPAETLRTLLKEFDSIGPFSQVAYSTDRGERFYALDLIVHSSATNDFGEITPIDQLSVISCDWNPALRRYNSYYDAAVAASKLPTWTQRQTGYEQVEARVSSIVFPPQTAREWSGVLTTRGRGRILADLLIAQNGLWVQVLFQAEDRVKTNRHLTHLGIALATHRAEQGTYPKTLNELVPDVLPKLPVDLFHKNPFVYRKTGDGYLLYCLGANGKDDKGSNEGEGWGGAKLEGVEVREPEQDYSVASDWDENGEYVGGSMANEDADDPLTQIPVGADDMSLRMPLSEPEPWPWETTP